MSSISDKLQYILNSKKDMVQALIEKEAKPENNLYSILEELKKIDVGLICDNTGWDPEDLKNVYEQVIIKDARSVYLNWDPNRTSININYPLIPKVDFKNLKEITFMERSYIYIPDLYIPNVTSFNFKNVSLIQKKLVITTEKKLNTLYYPFDDLRGLQTLVFNFSSEVTSLKNFFYSTGINEIILSDTSNVTDMSGLFWKSSIKHCPIMNTKNVTTMEQMFYQIGKIQSIPLLDCSSLVNTTDMFGRLYMSDPNISTLTKVGGFRNLHCSINIHTFVSIDEQSKKNIVNEVMDLKKAGISNKDIWIPKGWSEDLIKILTDKGWLVHM